MPTELVEPWEAFQEQTERLERARQALLGCLPVGRVEPAPVPVGLDLMADELAAISAELDAWNVPEMQAQWTRCADAVDEALTNLALAREIVASTDELQRVLHAVGEVVGPLEVWRDAERAWLAQRVRK